MTAVLGNFLQTRRDTIVEEWRDRVRDQVPARALSERALVDHVPEIVSRIAEIVQDGEHAEQADLGRFHEEHAIERLGLGFDLDEVVNEYAVLRRCILDLYERDPGGEGPTLDDLRDLDGAIDRFIAGSAATYAETRDRVLHALDRVADAAFGSEDLETFLRDLLHAATQAIAVVEVAAVLLRDEDRSWVGASIGIDADVEAALAGPSGAELLDRTVEEGRPILHGATAGAAELPGPFGALGLRSMYAVPLVHRAEITGVAVLGSRAANAFSEDDQLLFRAMASRASGVVVQSHLVAAERRARHALEDALARERESKAAAERALASLDSLLDASPAGIAFVDPALRFVRANEALAAMDGVGSAQHVGRTLGELRPDLAPRLEPLLRDVLATGRGCQIEQDVAPSPDQPPRALSANFFPVWTESGDVLGVGGVVVDITEQRRARDQAERRSAQLEAVVQAIPDPVLISDDRGLRMANRAALELGGASEIGPLDEALRRLSPRLLPDAPGTRTESLVEEVQVTEPTRRVVRVARAPIDVEGKPIGEVSILCDVTGRERAAAAQRFLAEASATLAQSLDPETTLSSIAALAVPSFATWVVVRLVGPGGDAPVVAFAHADPTKADAARALEEGYRPGADDWAGVARVLGTGEPEWAPTITEERLDAQASDPEQRRLLRELDVGSTIVVPLRARGRTLGTIGFVAVRGARPFDESDLALAAELARRAGLAVDNAALYTEATDAVRLREKVLATVSHDLRNPLWTLQMGVSLLGRKLDAAVEDPEVTKQVGILQGCVSQMDRLIGDLLDMASITAGKLSVQRRTEDAGSIVADAVARHVALASDAGVRLEGHPPQAGADVCCDRARILQVLGNLIGNAVKFTPKGGIVRVGAEVLEREVRFEVADSGPGIAPADQARLFEPYWSGADSRRGGGTGLGLYIARGIVEAHGGRIAVQSDRTSETSPGAGATFWFTVPRA